MSEDLCFTDRVDLRRSLWVVADMARAFGVSGKTVRGWVDRDDFPRPLGLVGNQLVWLRSDVEGVWNRPPRKGRQKVWTKHRIVAAAQEFNRRYARPPSATDWNVGALRKMEDFERLARFYEDGCYPHASCVYGTSGVFDSWADAIEAAGFRRPEPGRYETPNRRYRAADDVDARMEVPA